MDLPAPFIGIALLALGYCLARLIDRLRTPPGDGAVPDPARTWMQDTRRQRQQERLRVYEQFRSTVMEVVDAAVSQGHGSYGMLYAVRDNYGELLRRAPAGVTQAADSIMRCVTLLVNLGHSDERYAMFTRALHHFEAACADTPDTDIATAPGGALAAGARLRFSVLDTGVHAGLKELEPRR